MRENEKLIKKITHYQSIPFRLVDLFTAPVFVIFGITFLYILQPIEKSNFNYSNLYYILIIPLTTLFVLFVTIGRILMRWYRLKSLKYILTNQRILFLDSQFENIVESFELRNIEIDYTEKSDNTGYIIIDTPQIKDELFTSGSGKGGLKIFESPNIIYNIEEVRLVYKLIIETQKNAKQIPNTIDL